MRNRLFLFIRKHRIRTQLSVASILAIVLPMIIMGFILVSSTRSLLTRYFQDLLEADNSRIESIVSELSTQFYSISNEIVNDRQLNRLVKYHYYIPDNFDTDRKNVTVLEDVSSYPGIADIKVYTDNKHFFESPGIIIVDKEIKKTDWYKRAIDSQTPFWTVIKDISGEHICLVRAILIEGNDNKVVVAMTLDDSYIAQKIGLNGSDSVEILLDDRSIVFTNDYDMHIDEATFARVVSADGSLESINEKNNGAQMRRVDKVSLYGTDSSSYIFSYDNSASRRINIISIVEIILVALTMFLAIMLVEIFNGYFTRRVGDLRNAIHQVSNDEYDLSTYELVGGDEVSEAFEDIKLMIEKIKNKDAEMYNTVLRQSELEKRQQEVEFEMLASQINPHFLYNTLETIRMKAFTNGDREVASAIKLLGKSMRYVLENIGTQYTSLEKELEHIKIYLSIQKLRFENKFEESIEIEDGINPSKVVMLPLLLQPIVENSIVHGLEEVEAGGFIRIQVNRIDDGFQITISDNGEGMNSDALSALITSLNFKDIARNKSIGLHNVNQRLILAYGYNNELRIESTYNVGTSVSIRIPNEQSDNDVVVV